MSARLPATVNRVPESGVPGEALPAAWGPRFGAWCLDGLIALVITAVVAIPFGDSGSSNDDASALGLLIAVVVCTAYYWLTMCRGGERNGQTLGKQAVGIRVVRNDGQPVRGGIVLFRELFLKFFLGWITAVGWLIDGLWPLGDRENRAIHDHIAATHVVTVPARVRAPRPLPQPPLALAPDIECYLTDARRAATRIRGAIDRAELPYAEVGHEIDSLLGVMDRSAQRAQLLHEALDDTPVTKVEGRLAELEGDADRQELIDALDQQLEVQRRMQRQLSRFKDEMERIVVELETIRGSLLNVAASTDVEDQERLADRVRGLRDGMSAVATGMSAGYDADD